MDWGGPEFVLAIIAIATFGGIMKMAIRAKHGLPLEEKPARRRGRRDKQLDSDEAELVQRLRTENSRLTDRLEVAEDRLVVLEKIVTDRGYTLAQEIEALRDRDRDDKRLERRLKEGSE